jgi:hypothetical protein
MSRSLVFSQVPITAVSRDTLPSSPSEEIFFHSLKCSHEAVMLPTLVSSPFERMIRAL